MGPRTKGLRVSVRLPPWPAVKHCGSGPPKTGAEGSVAPSLKTMADATYRKESNGNWEDDITVVTNNDVNTTGGHKVWTAAKHLRDFLEAEAVALQLNRPGLRVLELGAGCGWLGLTLARNVQGCDVVLTEQDACGAVEHLWENIRANEHLVGNRVTAETLDWTQCVPHSLDGGEKDPGQKGASCNKGNVVHPIWDREWDLVIGSDLVYNSVGVEVLPRVLERLARRGSLVLYGHSLGRFELMDNAFKDNLRGLGLDVKQASGGSDTTATSAEDAAGEEFVMELFPELRPVVFIIEPAHPDAGS